MQALRDTLMPELGADASLCTDADLAELVSSVGCELGPVAAIVGGVLAGELIKAASVSGHAFASTTALAYVHLWVTAVPPIFPEGCA